MKNFEQITAKELISKIEFYYKNWDSNIESKNSARAFVDSAQILFGLEGFSITETIQELKKIVGE